MKKRAKCHLKPDDVRKSQVLETVAEFLDSILGHDCIVTKLPKLLAIHPDTGNEAVAEELYNCSSLLESPETFGYSLVEMIDDEEVVEDVFEIKVDEISLRKVQLEDKKFPTILSVENSTQPPKKHQSKPHQNLDPKQKEWVKKELKDSALEIETSYGKKIQRVCNKCGFRSISSENAFRAHLKTHLNESDEEQPKKKRFIANFDPSFIEQKLWIQEQIITRKENIETVEGVKTSWSCSECEFVCTTRASFRNHLQKFHTTILMRGPNKHSCYSCHLRFDGENHLKVHNNCHRIFDLIAPHVSFDFSLRSFQYPFFFS